ncbi:MAG: OmpA family protein [Candidatus Krumholzibacteriota bacterium]|nr:OmpA family protein [Candidatus Krumholzibacteriota bacterium]
MRTVLRLFLILAIVTFFAGVVNAQASWDGTAGLLKVHEAGTVGKGKLVFSFGSSYYRRYGVTLMPTPGSYYYSATGTDPEVNYNFFVSKAVLTLGLSDYVELAASLDVRNWIMVVPDEFSNSSFETLYRGGLGDTKLLGKLCMPMPTDRFRMGLLAAVNFPTGNKERNFTTDEIDFGIKGLFTLDLTDIESFVPTKLHINLGYQFNRNEANGYGILNTDNPNISGFYPPAYPAVPEGASDNFNDLFQFGTGVEFILKDTRLFVEFSWDEFLKADYEDGYGAIYTNKNIYTITPGISYVTPKGAGILAGIDINLNSEDNWPISDPPDWMAYLGFSVGGFVLAQDSDKDGIEDKVDKCADQPEDFDGFEDDDGCPDLDNDADGIQDQVDQCPDLAEDFDGFEDEDGCPDLDNDGDGIPDIEDRCPSEPEDFDGFEDSDGCPDIIQDSDNDGVADDQDKCPLKPEDLDGFQDEDGCPDLDNDLDGILDVNDQCPMETETFNGYMDEDGCPDERPIEAKFILRGVNFESGSASLTPDSYAVLDQVVKSLMAYPEVKVEVRGYTDSVGSWETNLRLSEKRAESVKHYLINSGIMADRVLAKGYGEADPVSSNKTAAGRAENRRIEFHRLN